MMLELRERKIVETIDRRALGALELVDAVTELPLPLDAQVRILSINRVNPTGQPPLSFPVSFDDNSVRLLRNHRGRYVILRAPAFSDYVAVFENPPYPPALTHRPQGSNETITLVLRVSLAVTYAGPHYLPRQFTFDLPRSLNASAADTVFNPIAVPLFRSPAAPAQDGSAVLRVSVRQADNATALPGVLLTAFRTPRAAGERPVGQGMTDWRGRVSGEALVPLPGLRRFRPGAGPVVVVASETIELEAARDSSFTGAPDTFPDVRKITAAAHADVIKPPLKPQNSVLEVTRPAGALSLTPGQEMAVALRMS